jgi:adenylate cyclase class IV
MDRGGQEREIKLYVADLDRIRNLLEEMGAQITHQRALEVNLRFDTPQRDLGRHRQALRVRHYDHDTVTFKGPTEFVGGVRERRRYLWMNFPMGTLSR